MSNAKAGTVTRLLETTDGVFCVEVGDLLGREPSAFCMVYSPLRKAAVVFDADELLRFEGWLREGCPKITAKAATYAEVWDSLAPGENGRRALAPIERPELFSSLTILPTTRCNFRCRYCYSQSGRESRTADIDHVRSALDFFFAANSRSQSPVLIAITGGGEPLLAREQVRFALSYSEELAARYDLERHVRLVTNGSITDKDVIELLERHHVSVCVSFEILEEMQNQYRNEYDLVATTIRAWCDAGLKVGVNSTLVPETVGRQEEMVGELLLRFPRVGSATFEPFMPPESPDFSGFDPSRFYREFLASYEAAAVAAKDGGLDLGCSFAWKIDALARRACPGKLCLTPHGTFTVCHLTSSPKEDRYSRCVYGHIAPDNRVVFNYDKFQGLQAINVDAYPECRNCFAMWHCCGGCMAKRDGFSQEMMDAYCDCVREFARRALLRRLDGKQMRDTGASLHELAARRSV